MSEEKKQNLKEYQKNYHEAQSFNVINKIVLIVYNVIYLYAINSE